LHELSRDKNFSGERLENLLFVTNSEKLKSNIGVAETSDILARLKQIPKSKVLDLSDSSDVLVIAQTVRKEFNDSIKGVVIVGGYDVIPAAQFNVASDELRKRIEQEKRDGEDITEVDDFIIWSDDIYGDIDNDFLPELPVSRIPDGKSAELLLSALQVPAINVSNKFGVRNSKRPFAVEVFDGVPYKAKARLEVSEEFSPKLVQKEEVSGAVYFMLHGSSNDATRFLGEVEDGENELCEAFDIYNVPKTASGTIVFSGCCYGALIGLPKADRMEPGISIRSRTPEQSIALAFLQASANAFIGCTGAHYSPRKLTENFYGKPMHTAFWSNIKMGVPPSQALFNAKKEYALAMPHNLTRAMSIAIELKTLHQFTCLGLGW
jgi:hypothetical protein